MGGEGSEGSEGGVGGVGSDVVAAGWRERARSVVAPVAAAGGAVLVVAGWWYVGVRARTGRFAPTIESDRLTSALAPPGFAPDAGRFASEFARNVDDRFWGSFGWYTIRFPTWLAACCTLVVVAAVVAALLPRRDESGSTRWQRAALLVPFVLLGGLVLSRAWRLYATTSSFPFMQGRYLFAGLVGLFVLVALGLTRAVGRWAPVAAAVAAALLQAEALRRCLQGWWGGPGLGPRGQVQALVAWSAWPGEALAVLGLVAVGLGAWFAVALVRFVLRVDDGRPVGSMPT